MLQQRDAQNKLDSQALVAKLRDEYAKGLDAIDDALHQERTRQYDAIEE